MKRFLTRASVAGLSAAIVAGVALVAAPAASAAQVGTLSFSGLTSQDVGFSVTSSAACPAGTNFLVRMTNAPASIVPGNTANLPAVLGTPNLIGNNALPTTSSGFTFPSGTTLRNFAADNGLTAGLGAGSYLVEMVCRTSLSSTSLGEFSGIVVIGSGAGLPVLSAGPLLQNVSTSSVVSAAPASINNTQSSIFTATTTPASGSTIAGSVQFVVDGAPFGAPVPVSASGVAVSGSYSPSSVGVKNVVANFLGGSDANKNYSTSSGNTTLAVTQATAGTTTNLSLSSASVAYPATVTATATVTGPVTIGSGTVQFKVDGTNVGSPVPVSASGVAVSAPISRNAGGPYAVTAEFSGATIGGIAYGASASPSAAFNVTAAQFAPDVQFIKTTIPAGTLVISTPYSCATLACDLTTDNPLNLGNMVLNATATEYSALVPSPVSRSRTPARVTSPGPSRPSPRTLPRSASPSPTTTRSSTPRTWVSPTSRS